MNARPCAVQHIIWASRMNEMEDRESLELVTVAMPYGRTKTLAELVNGWDEHVKRLRAEEHRSSEDPSVWGAHDYLAALHLRDLVIAGADQSPSEIREVALRLVASVDEAFRAFTEPDSVGVVDGSSADQHSESQSCCKHLPNSVPVLA